MKKMKNYKRIFSLVLVLCMLCSMFSFSALAEETTVTAVDVPFIPIKMPYNADIIGKTGETAGDNWAAGIKEANKRFGLSGDANRTLAKNIENDAISINEGGYAKDKGNYIEGDTYYKYKIESTSLSVGKDDALSVSMTPAKLETSGRPIEKIALLKYAFLNPGGVPVNYTVNYKDGTSVTTTSKEYWGESELEYVAWYGKATDGDWNRNNHYLLPNETTKVLEAYTSSSANHNTSILDVSSESMKSFQVLYLPVDKTKSVDNITINSNYGVDALYFLAATEIPVKTAELQAKVTEVEKFAISDAEEKADDIMLAKRYADELIERGINTSSDFAKLNALVKEAEWHSNDPQDVPFIPIKMPYNADIIGKTGETAGDNWAYGIKEANKRFGLSGDANRTLAKNIENDAISINEGGYAKDKGNYIEGDTYYKYKIESTSLSVGENDALSVSTTAATLKTSGRPIEKIALLKYAFLNPGDYPVTYTVNYTDGTSVATAATENWGASTLDYVAWYGSAADGDWNRNDQYLLPNATTGVLEAYTSSSANHDASILDAAGGMKSFQILYLPVDKTKSVDNITIKADYGNGSVFFLAATEIPVKTAELQAKIAEVNKLTLNDVTGANVADIFLANEYADELVDRYITHESEFSHLRELNEEAKWFVNEVIDMPFIPVDMPYNADIIGKLGETAGDNWAYGVTDAKKRFGLSGDATRTLAKNIENDAISINEGGYAKDKGVYIEGDTYYNYKIKSSSLSVGENDAVSVSMTAATLETSGRPIEKIALLKYAFLNPGDYPVTYTVNYTDGTSVATAATENWGASTLDYVAWYGSAADGDWNRNDQYLLPNATTGVLEAYTSSSANHDASILDAAGGMKSFQILYLPVDKTKSVENVTIKANYGSGSVFFLAATEIPVATTELADAVDGYQPPEYISNDAQSTEVKKLMWYANELEARYYKKASSYEAVNKLYKQALAQDETYVDLASQHTLDSDLFVKIGDTAVGTPTRTTLLYQGTSSVIGDNGLITTDLGSFKLSGKFRNAGYDSVYMAKDDTDKSFTLSNKQLKTVGLIVGADIASNANDSINAYLTYTDGSSKKEKITVYGPNTTDVAQLEISAAAKYDSETNTYVLEEAEGVADMKLVPAYINADPTKKVASITFESDADFSYSIIAITEIPYTNDELYNAVNTLLGDYFGGTNVTNDNAGAVLELCEKAYEAEARTIVGETVTEYVDTIYNVANAIANAILSFETEITKDATYATATVTMTNTTSSPQEYQLIIAAYDAEDGRLLSINFSEEKTLDTGKENITDSVRLGVVSGAEYKAFVWSGFDDMIPLGN